MMAAVPCEQITKWEEESKRLRAVKNCGLWFNSEDHLREFWETETDFEFMTNFFFYEDGSITSPQSPHFCDHCPTHYVEYAEVLQNIDRNDVLTVTDKLIQERNEKEAA